MQGQHGHLSTEQKQLAFRLRKRGWRLVDIAREIGCTAPMVGAHGSRRKAPAGKALRLAAAFRRPHDP